MIGRDSVGWNIPVVEHANAYYQTSVDWQYDFVFRWALLLAYGNVLLLDRL